MNWKAHLIIGVICAAVFVASMHAWLGWYPFTITTALLVILIAVISPLVPDIDHENGKLPQIMVGIGLSSAVIGAAMYYLAQYAAFFQTNYMLFIIAGITLAGTTFAIQQFSTHRGFAHSITLCALYAVAILLLTRIDYQLAALGFVGSWSHLWADSIPFKLR